MCISAPWCHNGFVLLGAWYGLDSQMILLLSSKTLFLKSPSLPHTVSYLGTYSICANRLFFSDTPQVLVHLFIHFTNSPSLLPVHTPCSISAPFYFLSLGLYVLPSYWILAVTVLPLFCFCIFWYWLILSLLSFSISLIISSSYSLLIIWPPSFFPL